MGASAPSDLDRRPARGGIRFARGGEGRRL